MGLGRPGGVGRVHVGRLSPGVGRGLAFHDRGRHFGRHQHGFAYGYDNCDIYLYPYDQPYCGY